MAFKEVEYDSVVVSATGVIVPTCNVSLKYANGTSKRSIISIGDTIAVKFIRYENLSTSYGRVTDLKADYLVLDDSENFSSSKKKIYYCSIRDITNISSPDKDMMFDRFNLPISKPSEEKPDEEVNDNVIANIANKMDTIINSIQVMNNDVSTLRQSLSDLSEEVHNPSQPQNPDTGDNTDTGSTDDSQNSGSDPSNTGSTDEDQNPDNTDTDDSQNPGSDSNNENLDNTEDNSNTDSTNENENPNG